MNGKYESIKYLPHHVSQKHPQMSMLDRAAQFSPFAALTGYDAAVQETARLTDFKIELAEDDLIALNAKLQLLQAHLAEKPEISIIYFEPDSRKAGGTYLSCDGTVKRIDEFERCITMTTGQKIPIDDVLDIVGDIFKELED